MKKFKVIDQYLNIILLNSIIEVPVFYEDYRYAMDLMYYTGCRASEALDLSRWEPLPQNQWKLRPLKSNNARYFHKSVLSPDFLVYWTNYHTNSTRLTYKKLQFVSLKSLSKYGFNVGNKQSLLHLFRYNFVFKQIAKGLGEVEIKEMLGHIDIQSTRKYIDAEIEALWIPTQ